MTIYDKVKEIADEKNMPISALESEAGLSNGTIGGWRSAKPYAESLQKVAGVLGVSIEDLLTDG